MKTTAFKRRAFANRDLVPCHYCGTKLSYRRATVDHVVPKSKGGPNAARNYVIACRRCQKLKADKQTDLQTVHNRQFVRAARAVRASRGAVQC